MTDPASYLVFLAIGLVLLIADGQLVTRSGRTFLLDVYPNEQSASAASRLTVALFHLVGLGLLALTAVVPPSGDGPAAVIARLGVFLLVLAAAHAATMAVLNSLVTDQELGGPPTANANTARQHDRAAHGVAPDVPSTRPNVAPGLDKHS